MAKSAAYDKGDSNKLPMTILFCVWSLVRLGGILAKVLPVTKLIPKKLFHELKKGGL